jgi:hypothetical protein
MEDDQLRDVLTDLGYGPLKDPRATGDFTVTTVRAAVLACEKEDDSREFIHLCALLACHPDQPLGAGLTEVADRIDAAIKKCNLGPQTALGWYVPDSDGRLLVPRADPHLWEQPADLLFDTEDEAHDWRDEEIADATDVGNEAEIVYIRSWVLCKRILEPVEINND